LFDFIICLSLSKLGKTTAKIFRRMCANRQSVKGILRQDAGEEPWDIVAVGVMTDASNTHEKASAEYGDISFRSEQ